MHILELQHATGHLGMFALHFKKDLKVIIVHVRTITGSLERGLCGYTRGICKRFHEHLCDGMHIVNNGIIPSI